MSFYGWRQQQKKIKKMVELEASLAPAVAEVGAVANADQQPIALEQPQRDKL